MEIFTGHVSDTHNRVPFSASHPYIKHPRPHSTTVFGKLQRHTNAPRTPRQVQLNKSACSNLAHWTVLHSAKPCGMVHGHTAQRHHRKATQYMKALKCLTAEWKASMCCNMSSPHAFFNTHTASSTNACPLLDNMPDPKQGALSQKASIELPMHDWLPTAATGQAAACEDAEHRCAGVEQQQPNFVRLTRTDESCAWV